MKNFNLTLNEDQAHALGYILRNAHHVPLPNVIGEDTILPLSREIMSALDDAPEIETGEEFATAQYFVEKRDDSLTPRIDPREFYEAMSRLSCCAQDICS